MDARLDLDDALAALPEKYRTPVILCHLQGWTRRDLAAHLGCPESTASSLVGRGLAKLRKRLAGAEVPLAFVGFAVVPPGLARAATRAAAVFRTNSPAAGVSPAVAELTEGVLNMFRAKQWAAGLAAAAVVAAGIGFGLVGWSSPRAEAQPAPQAADVKTRREKLEAEIAAAKARLKQLEDDQRELLKPSTKRPAEQKAAVEPHIGLWVRSPAMPAGGLGLRGDWNRDAAAESLAWMHRYGPAATPGGGWRSEFAVNEFTAGRPVVEAHFFSLGSLKTYLARAAKDPVAPKKLRVHADREYPWAKLKPVLDTCKEAGFAATELATTEGGQEAPGKAARGSGSGILLDAAGAAPDAEAADNRRHYVVICGPQGERVHSLPATGAETVIDAIDRVDGLLGRAAAAQVWIACRARLDGQPPQILPVDVAGITRHGQTATNYQILPGDRVYVMPRE